MNNNELARLRELAGIIDEPVTPKTKKQLDEGVIGAMQTINHVSVREGDYSEGEYNEGDYSEESMTEGQEGIVMTKVDNGQKITTNDILQDIKAGYDDALYFATEEQVSQLIDAGKISEDYFSHWQAAREEMEYMKRDAEQEFGGIRENDLNWNDHFDNDREAGGSYESPDENRARVARVKAYLASQDAASKEVAEGQGVTNPRLEGSELVIDFDGEKHYVSDDSLIALASGDTDSIIVAYPEDAEGAHDRLTVSDFLDSNDLMELMPLAKQANSIKYGHYNESSYEMDESDMDTFANTVDEDMLVSKSEKIATAGREMIARGMDPEQVVMSLADEYGLDHEEQFDLYDMITKEESGMSQDARDALDDAQERKMSLPPEPNFNFSEETDDDVKPDFLDLDNDGDTEEPMSQAADDKRYMQKKEVAEDFDNGYDTQINVDADGYFPDGAHHSVSDKAGPASAKQGDNPLQKSMKEASGLRLVKVIENGNKQSKIYKDSEYQEFRVMFYTDGEHHGGADYHTDDQRDAIMTAQNFVKDGLRASGGMMESKSIHNSLVSGYRQFKK